MTPNWLTDAMFGSLLVHLHRHIAPLGAAASRTRAICGHRRADQHAARAALDGDRCRRAATGSRRPAISPRTSAYDAAVVAWSARRVIAGGLRRRERQVRSRCATTAAVRRAQRAKPTELVITDSLESRIEARSNAGCRAHARGGVRLTCTSAGATLCERTAPHSSRVLSRCYPRVHRGAISAVSSRPLSCAVSRPAPCDAAACAVAHEAVTGEDMLRGASPYPCRDARAATAAAALARLLPQESAT